MESCLKRAFSLLLGFVLVLSLVPATAFATQTDTEIQASAAVNASTGAVYAAVSEACDEAEAGQTVRLNCDYTEDTVVVDEGVTLDLAGHTLEVDYMVCYGAIIDSSEGTNGLLTVPSNHLILENTNPQLPVKVGEGYHFVEIIGYNTAMVNENKYAFQPLFEADAHPYLAAGTVATGVTIQVDVSWLQGGQEPHAKFAYSDDLLTGYINSYKPATGKYGKMFTLTKQSTGYYRNLGFEAVVVSDTQVQIGAGVTYPQGKIEVDSDNKLVGSVTVQNPQGNATIQAGTRLEDASSELKLTTTKLDSTGTDITLSNGEEMQSFDVHVSGIAKDNTVPVIITLDKLAPEFLNKGNLALYHVENGATMPMTRVYTLEEVDAHNEYYYDIATGTVTLAMATFSEVATVSETAKPWEGGVDHTWYDPNATELIIANADQLWSFSQIVGGMAEGIAQDSFSGKTVKLIADINLADDEANNDPTKIFYPIGYYSSDGKYEKTGVAISSSLKTFEGTFDGQGHTISNIYQNTWEMKGDHDWYDASLQYYRDGMGLFGKVYGGTVKNLTVKNFTSDGEITTTGCVAAYADFGATFENIAIFNCNPRVYNIGNGGIVGAAGWYTKAETDKKITFTNVTVDNSNKISALWGTYDAACGGIVGQYYPTSGQSAYNYPANPGVHFENCHVAAQMDVYNDVCANYQYYAYRYTGMMIGSVRENVTIDGHVYPKMDGITASGCTVHFGDWNDYYYCEIIDNTTASYTHDYQMSRLTEVKAFNGTTVTYLDDTTGTVPASGRANYVIVDYTKGHGTENATCYHFKDGAVWTHDMGGIQTGIDENGDGQDDLKEDKQHIYLEFNNLFTGYGWGVTSKGVGDLEGVTILDRQEANSVVKFESAVTELENNKECKLGDIFSFVNNGVEVVPNALTIAVENLDESNPVSATFVRDDNNWENGAITFTGTGKIKLTIQDYYFCTPTTINVTITERQPEQKFDVVMNNGDFLHRVGNQGTVDLSKLFSAKDGATIGVVSVTIETVDGTGASGTYANNAIQFSGTGVVKVTITDNDYCIPTELYLEVVDATNVTSATNAEDKNIVLLNDCGFSSIEVSGGYTLYGNGFTMTCGSDSPALDMGYAFVTLSNGTLDNVQIVVPNFSHSILYKRNYDENGNTTDDSGKRYYNIRSAVMVSGNSQILNSKISGGRAAVYATSGNILIDNTTIIGGAAANIHIVSPERFVLRDATLIQVPTKANVNDTSKTVMGFSIVTICDANGITTPITLEGDFVQYAWAHKGYSDYIPKAGSSALLSFDVVSYVLKKTDYIHSITYADGTTADSVNLGICYLPDERGPERPTVNDYRSNTASVPYDITDINGSAFVCSIKNSVSTDDSVSKLPGEYVPNKYGDIIIATYSDTADGLTSGKSFGADGWVYELNVDLDKLSGYKFDFSKLSMSVNGVTVADFKVNGGDKPSTVAVTAGGTTYTLTATVNGKEYTATYKVTGTETSKESPTLVAANYEAGLCVASSYGGTWHGAAPALKGIQIKYWSVAEKQYKTITLSDYTPTTKGQLNGTNTTWTYSPANGDFTLTLTGGQVHSSNNVYAMPVVCDETLYFVAASSKGLVNSGNSARTIPVSYTFKDNNNGDVLTFSHTWSVAENKDEQYKYSDFCNGTKTQLESGGSCVTPETLITLADGTQKRVDSLTGDELLLVWNLETGKYEAAPIVFVDSEEEAEYEIIHLYFSDGSDVKVIYEHGFFDLDLGKYVYIDANNYAQFVGHRFVTQGDLEANNWNVVTLDNVVIEKEVTTAWSPVTSEHLCYYTNGVLSMPGGISGLFNIFDVNTETMSYDAQKKAQDIETYGLFTLEDFGGLITQEAFDAFNGAYLKVAMGKGLLTWEDIAYMAERYIPLM